MTLGTMEAEVRVLKRELADLRRLMVRGEPPFDVVAKEDGTWLCLNGKRFKSCLRLEDAIDPEMTTAVRALAEVREALLERSAK